MNRFAFKVLITLGVFLNLCACTYSVHLVNFSEDLPTQKKASAKLVEAKSSQFVILGFITETDYVNEAYNELQNKCPQGHIGGISTKFYTSHGFLSWTNHIEMDGYCYN